MDIYESSRRGAESISRHERGPQLHQSLDPDAPRDIIPRQPARAHIVFPTLHPQQPLYT